MGLVWAYFPNRLIQNSILYSKQVNTLFIKLDKPAKTVKIDGLPENVVCITRGSKNIECTFSSDLKEYIHRSQV
jgi:hypothetical protein